MDQSGLRRIFMYRCNERQFLSMIAESSSVVPRTLGISLRGSHPDTEMLAALHFKAIRLLYPLLLSKTAKLLFRRPHLTYLAWVKSRKTRVASLNEKQSSQTPTWETSIPTYFGNKCARLTLQNSCGLRAGDMWARQSINIKQVGGVMIAQTPSRRSGYGRRVLASQAKAA